MAAEAVSAQVVGNAFVQQYYHVLHHSPELVFRFYQDISKLGRPEEDGSMTVTTTLQGINEKIVSLNYGDFRAEVKSIDSQESYNGGVHVIVTGHLIGKENVVSNFAQTFFLAPQDKGYFVLNDMFRYLDSTDMNSTMANNVVLPVTLEHVASPVQENHVPEETVAEAAEEAEEEAVAGEVYDLTENVDLAIAEEVPEAGVIDEVQNDAHIVIESNVKIEEAPKKSYASIVMHLKESGSTFSPPPAATRRAPPKKIEQVNSNFASTTDGPVSSNESTNKGNNQDGEVDGHSIYIKGLPMNASESLLEEVFKKFGAIKLSGIQVRSNKQQGFCFGFVEFEEASSVQKAVEASPVAIGPRQVFVEEKRSTNSRGNNRVRFQTGRGSGFRNEGGRGRGNNGGGRGYNKGEFSNKAGNRTGSSNPDGYQNTNSNLGHINRIGGMANGNARNLAPQVSASA